MVKIISTIGPRYLDQRDLLKKIIGKSDIIRFNFSHFDEDIFEKLFELILEFEIPILADLRGRELRVYSKTNQYLSPNSEGIIYMNRLYDEDLEEKSAFIENYFHLKIISQDNYSLKIKNISKKPIIFKKDKIYKMQSPDFKLIDKEEKKVIKFLRKYPFDFLALSLVINENDLYEIKDLLFSKFKIVSKIEWEFAFKNLDKLIDESDYIMIARGDLGSRNIYLLPLYQEKIIENVEKKGKQFIIATHLSISLEYSNIPFRSEVIELYNTLKRKPYALLLADETVKSRNPIKHLNFIKKMINLYSK